MIVNFNPAPEVTCELLLSTVKTSPVAFWSNSARGLVEDPLAVGAVSYTHLTLPTTVSV